jgi:hypothetical protein
METRPQVEAVEVEALTIPTDRPESDATLAWSETTMIVVSAASRPLTVRGWRRRARRSATASG